MTVRSRPRRSPAPTKPAPQRRTTARRRGTWSAESARWPQPPPLIPESNITCRIKSWSSQSRIPRPIDQSMAGVDAESAPKRCTAKGAVGAYNNAEEEAAPGCSEDEGEDLKPCAHGVVVAAAVPPPRHQAEVSARGLAIGVDINSERWVRIFGILGSGNAGLRTICRMLIPFKISFLASFGGPHVQLDEGRVVGGVVAGTLRAATPIKVIVGSFLPNSLRQHQRRMGLQQLPSAVPALPAAVAPPPVLTAAMPISQAAPGNDRQAPPVPAAPLQAHANMEHAATTGTMNLNSSSSGFTMVGWPVSSAQPMGHRPSPDINLCLTPQE